MKSIRAHLIVWLSVLFSAIWLVVTGMTYWSSQYEVEEVYDAQLAQAAAVLSEIHNLKIESPNPDESRLSKEVYGHRYEVKIAFQIWADNTLILRSASAPTSPMSNTLGFSDQKIGAHTWRVFQMIDADSGRTIFTGERDDVRNELIELITFDVLLPVSIALPLFLILIWFGIGRGLTPVNRIADQVSHLSAQNLEPVVIKSAVPHEISPLVVALNALFTKLKTAFERERRFTSDAAHELQTPLASIKTQTQIALRSNNPDERSHALKQIEEGVNRAARLVQQLLTLSRYDPDSFGYAVESVALDRLATEVISDLEPAAYQKQIDIGLHSASPISLAGHAAGLRVLLRNLIDNAIRYSPAGGRITISLEQRANSIMLEIADTGPGIPLADQQRVFERFYRGQNQQHIPGSGLGLSIVQRIVELHSGKIYFDYRQASSEFKVCVELPISSNL